MNHLVQYLQRSRELGSDVKAGHHSRTIQMHIRFVPTVVALLAVASGPAIAQPQTELSATRMLQQPAGRRIDSRLFATSNAERLSVRLAPKIFPAPQTTDAHRTRNAVIGGVIGSVVGIGVCTGISSLMNDSAKGGFSTCTTKGNLAFAAGGFVAGALVGAAIR